MSAEEGPGEPRPEPSASNAWVTLGGKGTLTPARIAVAALALSAFAVFTWYAYDQATHPAADGTAPLIKAEAGPTRVRPDKPGGMEVPHRDKLVYERIEGGKPKSRVERLLPPPEMPRPRPAPKPAQRAAGESAKPKAAGGPLPPPEPPMKPAKGGLAKGEPAAKSSQGLELAAGPDEAPAQPKAKTQPDKPPPAQPESTSPPGTKPAVAPKTKPGTKPEESRRVQTAVLPPKPATAPAPDATAPTKAATRPEPGPSAAYRIQLAAVRTQEGAERAWRSLKKKHADLLTSLNLTVEWVDLGAKGVFYRVQAGPLTQLAAKKACAELRRRKTGCLVVRP